MAAVGQYQPKGEPMLHLHTISFAVLYVLIKRTNLGIEFIVNRNRILQGY
jgi:hypothetical protein